MYFSLNKNMEGHAKFPNHRERNQEQPSGLSLVFTPFTTFGTKSWPWGDKEWIIWKGDSVTEQPLWISDCFSSKFSCISFLKRFSSSSRTTEVLIAKVCLGTHSRPFSFIHNWGLVKEGRVQGNGKATGKGFHLHTLFQRNNLRIFCLYLKVNKSFKGEKS